MIIFAIHKVLRGDFKKRTILWVTLSHIGCFILGHIEWVTLNGPCCMDHIVSKLLVIFGTYDIMLEMDLLLAKHWKLLF